MSPEDAVTMLLNLASLNSLRSPSSHAQVSEATLVPLIVTVRALLERIRTNTASEQDKSAFGRLICTHTIRLLIECRQSPAYATLESWPHLLLLHLSEFCSSIVTRIPKRKTRLDELLTTAHQHACAQLPGVSIHTSASLLLDVNKCCGTRFYLPLFARIHPPWLVW